MCSLSLQYFPTWNIPCKYWDFTDDFDFSGLNPTHVPSDVLDYNSFSSYTYNRGKKIKYKSSKLAKVRWISFSMIIKDTLKHSDEIITLTKLILLKVFRNNIHILPFYFAFSILSSTSEWSALYWKDWEEKYGLILWASLSQWSQRRMLGASSTPCLGWYQL